MHSQLLNESNAGGILLYIANHLSNIPRIDLSLNKVNQLEYTFKEIINSRQSNIIVFCFYKHPNMVASDFRNYFYTRFDKLPKENE